MQLRFLTLLVCFQVLFSYSSVAQVKWQNVDSLFQPLPPSVHVYKTTDMLDGKPNIAYYVEVDLKDKKIEFAADTTYQRRLKPSQFFEKNNQPLVVVNCTFFSFATNQNLNVVIKDGKLVGYNKHSIPGRGKDTLTFKHPFGSAIGIGKKRNADVAWLYTDSAHKHAYARQWNDKLKVDSFASLSFDSIRSLRFPRVTHASRKRDWVPVYKKWDMQTAVGGGPVLLHGGDIKITNNEEYKFIGKAIDDKHPRTAMGYTKNNKLIILAIEGRSPGLAEGATLVQEAKLLQEIGCQEALNLDGGGSSCLLVNGKETIKPSDKEGQRPVPAVFIVKSL